MTRRQLLATALTLPAAPALAALPIKPKKQQKRFDVTVAYESEQKVIFDMKYSIGDTKEPWRLIGRSFIRPCGQHFTCVTAKYEIPVHKASKDVARWAGYAMSVYFLPEGERPVGKRYTYTIREEKAA